MDRQTPDGGSRVRGLSRHIEEIRTFLGRIVRRGLTGQATLGALLAFVGATALPAVGSAAAPGQLYAFGENRFGELGNKTNNLTEKPNPTPTLATLPSASDPVTRIAVGDGYSLALISAGQLYAFGRDYGGELGTPPGNERDAPHPTPTPVLLPGGASISTMATGPWSDHTLVVSQLGVANSSLPAGGLVRPTARQCKGLAGARPIRGLPADCRMASQSIRQAVPSPAPRPPPATTPPRSHSPTATASKPPCH